MAKTLDELKNIRQQMIINLHTDNIASGYVADYMEQSAWTGEVAVQHFADDNAALWTLGKDNATAVEFISRKTIEGLLASAATLSIVSASPISANVQEEWVLKNLATGVECGEHIKIYKDQNVVSAKIGHMDDTINPNTGVITDGTGDTALVLTKLNASGFYETIKANIEDFVQEHEFKRGLTKSGHTIIGVVASGITGVDNHLFVDDRGFYLSGLTELLPISSGKTILVGVPTSSGTNVEVNIDNTTIGKDSNGVLSTLLMIASANPSTANVLEEWRLVDKDYNDIYGSSHIMIYKDSSLIKVYLGKTDDTCDPITGVITSGTTGATALCFLYNLSDGTYMLVTIDITLFFSEEIFKKGFYVDKSAHTIDVKIDEDSEPYLTVSMDGLKLSGVSAMNATEIVSAETTDAKVKEAWKLYNPIFNKQYGEIINIYKDQRIESAYTGHVDDTIDTISGVITTGTGETGFNFIKLNDEGKYELIKVNMQQFIEETEIGHGLEMSGHTLVGKVAPSGKSNDYFLFVDDDGFYTSGITNALSMEIVSAATTAVTVREAWMLYNSALTKQYGEIINIYKDQHIVEAMIGKSGATVDAEGKITDGTLENTVFLISRMNASGVSELIEIDMQQFIEENEIGHGLEMSGHTLVGKVAPFSAKSNDEFLYVDDDGFYTSGITEALSMEIVSAATSAVTVREAWMLYNSALTKQYGEIINIYKDQHIVEAMIGKSGATVDAEGKITDGTLENTVFLISRMNASGVSELIEIDMQQFIEENEIGHGLEMSGHTLVGKVASGITGVDNHLFVDDRGFYLSGLTELLPISSGKTILVGVPTSSGTNVEVNIDNTTIGKNASGVLSTLLIISAVTPSPGVKDEYALMDGEGNEISGSTHIKIGQTCKVSGETMAEAILAADRLGHVTVDSAMTSAGTVIYTIDKFDVAASSVVGSGWVASSITEVIIEDEEITAKALNYLAEKISALTPTSLDETVTIISSTTGTDYSVNIDNKTIVKDASGVLSTLLKIASATPSSDLVREEWKLVDSKDNEISGSSHIKVYKDSAIVSAFTSWSGGTVDETTGVYTPGSGTTEVLAIIYLNAEGKYKLVEIDLEQFVLEAEFKDGFMVSGHNIYVKIDEDSESYLTVSPDGLKLSGVSAMNATEIVSAETTDAKVKEAWKLYNPIFNKQYGEIINIYKDQHVDSAYLGHIDDAIDEESGKITEGSGSTSFCIINLNDEGKYQLIKVDMQCFIEESECKSGVTVDGNNILHGVVAPKSDPYLFVDGDGFFLSGLTNIESNVISGETMAEAILAADRLGHVTVDSVMTSAGTLVYLIDKYDVAASSVVGSGWVASSITEVIIEDEEIFANALDNLDLRVSANTEAIKALSGGTISLSSNDKTINISTATSVTDLGVNIDNITLGKYNNGILHTLLKIGSKVSAEAGIREEFALLDNDGNEISGSERIKMTEMSAYTKTSDFATINNSAITEGGNKTIIAPISNGISGQPLLSNGTAIPIWGTYKFAFITQAEYDALTTKDATTIYFIID